MKKLFLFFVIIFSFNFTFGQGIYLPKKVSPDKLISFWIKELSKPEIKSWNTSIKEYSLYGETYYLLFGEDGYNIDPRPLLIKPALNNVGFVEIQNLYPLVGDIRNQEIIKEYNRKNTIDVLIGCVLTKVNFFKEAKFVDFVWKKFPKSDYWEWQY